MTDGTFNLLAIAVLKERQNAGIGRAIVHALAARLKAKGGRVLLVETSALDTYAATRAFYLADGFVQEAVIRDFYTAGEDKVVFWKRL
jgi:ribosomal protein S18 acetylase RimI-like enzyme